MPTHFSNMYYQGLSGPKYLGDQPIEGSWKAHQVPISSPAEVPEQFEILRNWLESYKPTEIFRSSEEIFLNLDKNVIPSDPKKRMGQRTEAYNAYRVLKLPDWTKSAKEKGSQASETQVVGGYLRDVMKELVYCLG